MSDNLTKLAERIKELEAQLELFQDQARQFQVALHGETMRSKQLRTENERLKTDKLKFELGNEPLQEAYAEIDGLRAEKAELEARLDTTSDKLSAAYMDKCAENYQLEDQIDQLRTENERLRERLAFHEGEKCPDCAGSGHAHKEDLSIECSKCHGVGFLTQPQKGDDDGKK